MDHAGWQYLDSMNLDNAYRILGLEPDAGEEAVLRAFQTAREKLESKIFQAPTAGLKAKYRAALERLEEAYEVIDL